MTLTAQIEFMEKKIASMEVAFSTRVFLDGRVGLEAAMGEVNMMRAILTTLRAVKQGGWLPS